jgi:hypothetical protein
MSGCDGADLGVCSAALHEISSEAAIVGLSAKVMRTKILSLWTGTEIRSGTSILEGGSAAAQ